MRAWLRRSVAAGLVAAGVFIGYSMVAFVIGGRGLWQPVNLVAHTFWRSAPLDGRFHPLAAVIAGVALAAGGIVGMAFYSGLASGAALTPRATLIGAAVYGNLLWTVGHYFIWPELDPLAAEKFAPGTAWAAHTVAGVGGALYLVRGVVRTRLQEGRSHAH